ncbi:o-sialoglycoprotein endopeptidase [Chlamydia felis Fe/C-56]|uniref:O-sialoglycoprotein endopeptidase n=1 Tax=Chlamydia felis (strain Fe/C-56) TaxID=264202 RepID=Q253T4_CHLFF|nr:tRNA (adenosine(37)-N6)-threonylcarbamoyltransferase complex dimerization subunit type 1 TsaB [Chlamydia felis]BAE81454.1 o-sialoglycoprotein endopeptidase [Chlamydia felis Fe/C-56]
MHFHRYVIIDTSGYQPFLAYVDHQKVLKHWQLPVGPDQGVVLEFIFKNSFLCFQGIGVAAGPGNFSATRVGLSFAQGLALSKKVPMIGYSSLEGYLTPKDEGKALMLPLGKKGGVLTLSSDLSEDGFICEKNGVGPGILLPYGEASEYCLANNYYHVISPNPQLFIDSFSKKIRIEKVAPSINCIRRHVVSQLMPLECGRQLTPDYRSCSCFF